MTRDAYDRFTPPDRGRFGDNERAGSKPRTAGASDLHDITLALHHDTGRAVLVSSDGEESKAVWIPHSKIEVVKKESTLPGVRKNGQMVRLACVVVTMPEWLAREKGLL